jgi:outer membrane protein OmpA-like peptidoglycan-associated protein
MAHPDFARPLLWQQNEIKLRAHGAQATEGDDMKPALLLASAAVFVAACAAPDPIASVSSHAGGAAGLVDAAHASQTAPEIAPWSAYQTFDFDSAAVEVSISDKLKLNDIVAYLESNPSLDVGIDGTLDGEDDNETDRNLGLRRAASVRLALMNAGGGVSSYKIFTGAFADPDCGHAGQIQVLVGPRTGSFKTAQ